MSEIKDKIFRLMNTQLEFGEKIEKEAERLAQEGKDANQIANILCGLDKEGYNYGIGILLAGDGKPMASSPTLLDYAAQELKESAVGTYLNSSKLMFQLLQATLRWQRIPEKWWGHFSLAIPSDAGTGAVITGVELGILQHPEFHTLGVEEWGWPAYRAIAKIALLGFKEFSDGAVIADQNTYPIYQAGPLNSTGYVPDKNVMTQRAKAAAKAGQFVLLDRAYSGFENASLLAKKSYDDIMKLSYETQIEPFLDEGVSFSLALSPTKSFITFSLRPSGLLLTFTPDKKKQEEITNQMNLIVRARGSSFEHPITRAFVKAMVKDLSKLGEEHKSALVRVAESESLWKSHTKGTAIGHYFSDRYAGLFRNMNTKPGAAAQIYHRHIYPVFSNNRCRLNITGIPANSELAREHVQIFSKFCF